MAGENPTQAPLQLLSKKKRIYKALLSALLKRFIPSKTQTKNCSLQTKNNYLFLWFNYAANKNIIRF